MIWTGGKRLGAIAGGVALLGAVVYSMTARRAESQAQLPLSLRAEHVGRDLLITWDRSAVRKFDARRANVTISDGDARKELLLDPSELESGKILYAPRSGELAIRLDMHVSGGTVSESIRVLEQVSEVPPPEPQSPESRPVQPPPGPAPQPVLAAVSAPPKPEPPAPKPEPPAARRAFVAPASPRNAEQPKLSEPPLVAASRLQAPVPVPVGSVPVPPPAPPLDKPAAPAVVQIVQPVPLRRVQPIIPPPARPYMGLLTGPVIVDVETEIDAAGAVTRAQVLRVTAEPAASRGGLGQHLAFSALTAARNWRFEPAKRNGVPVPGRSIVTFRFSPPQKPK